MAGGAFQTSREIFGHSIWKNIVEFRLFFLIYGNAVFSEEGVKIDESLTLQRGQWLRSTRKIQEDLEYIENRQVKQYSTSTINRAIKSLSHVKVQMLCTKTHELGTVFTVVNYEQYQGFGGYRNMELGTQLGTVAKQSRNNNKNVKKEKNLKDLISCIFDHWMSKDLVKHRVLTPQINLQIKYKLNHYSEEEMIQAISSYDAILNNPDYKLNTRWGLLDFLEKGHFEKFLPDRDPYTFYPKVVNDLVPQKQSKLSKNKELLRGKGGGGHAAGTSQVSSFQSSGSLPKPN
ncbi:hypothetical protein [Bacillus sp. FJAT-26390]|uniref:hypothetical protein n=1 Tax=Bacillus sp. FJAT-26390 TaxID=1743142 RepID=UPI000807DD68|nr:hypothetical protein [Bacillus sp. FJAT-26390]OBZ08015.1 hypothetical protein A7975_27180 [Bacillus sp. FJAT-26390]